MLILGYDPGTRNQGFSLVSFSKEDNKAELKYQDTLVIKVKDIKYRILETYKFITSLVEEHKPDVLVVENVVMNGEVGSDINKLTGIVYLSCIQVKIHTYSPNAIKKIVTGYGSASKDAVSFSVKKMLNLEEDYTFDSNHSSDATGIALAYLIKELNYGNTPSCAF